MKTLFKIICCLVLFSCSGSDDDTSSDNKPTEPPIEGYFQAKIEGVDKKVENKGTTHYVEWRKSKDSHNRDYYGIFIYAYNQGFYLDSKIYTDNIEVGKEYVYVHTDVPTSMNMDFNYSETCVAPNCSSYWGCTNSFYGKPTGKITITSFDGKKMSGKIETKVNHQYFGVTTNQTRTISGGVFVNAEKATGSL
ncbi:hypothetical protein [Chryseobacterium sp.]|uniref:hypothetical protein n=1 Tax=Chryseobacterium sp. TaxID=1871047 RepID=UPI000ED07BF8|nr:hypothetical protein [Chryseobacterium sp.]HCM33098.1 hypothetical protein [Chryseobacterium sp.]